MSIKILRLPDVKSRTGLSRSAIYLLVSKGEFPAPIRLGARTVGWVDAEVSDWLDERIEQRARTVATKSSSGGAGHAK